MKFREVFRYEFGHRLRSPTTWIYIGIVFTIAFALIAGDAEGDNTVLVNAPIELASYLAGLSIFGLVISAALFGDAAVRDVQAEMDPLLYAAPLSKAEYLGGRFLAALAVNVLVMLAAPLGLAAATLLPNVEPGVFAPFRVAAYVQPWLLFLLPNIFLTGAILFAAGVLARHVIPAYLASIGIFVVGAIAANLVEMTDSRALWILGNPFGVSAKSLITEYWTVAERNTRLLGFQAALVWNRVFWVLVAAGVLAVLHHRFRFAHPGGRSQRKAAGSIVDAGGAASPRNRAEQARPAPLAVPRTAGSFGFRTAARQVLSIARSALAEMSASRSFVVVVLGCLAFTMLWGWNVGETVFETSTWPVTLLVAETVLSQRIVLLFFALIALYAGELVWKDREVGVSEIADAAPVSEGVALLGRFLALVAILAMTQLAIMVGGIMIQAFQGYYHFEIGLYLRILFGLNLAGYVLLAALAMTIHVVVNHKYLGHIIVLMACVFTMLAEPLLGIRHHLLVYSTDPGWTYSDMNGFGPFIGPFVWFKLYWSAWALLLGVLACVLWVRGRESGVRRRLRHARARFTGSLMRTAGVGSALIVVLGGFIFYNTNILNEYVTNDEEGASQAEYEKRYAQFVDVPQPTITDVALRVEIYPHEHAVDLRGSYALVNRTAAPIDTVHVFINPVVEARSISFDRDAKSVLADDELGFRIYTLDRALHPGESTQLAFDVAFRQPGFPNDGIQTHVVDNGAYFDRRWLPFIGYQPMFALSDDETRARFGLEPLPPLPGPDVVEARGRRHAVRGEDEVGVAMTIGTSADQIAITPGVLRREWTENGRRYFHYETETPTEFGATVFSAKYAVHEDRWNDVALSVFHHPDHDDNLDTFVGSMKASLDYYTAQFGPYQARILRVVEIPRYGSFGRAQPQTIAFTEDVFFTRPRDGEFDRLFFGNAHEVAHMWWGGQVSGASGVRGGQGFLSESLANYSAMMVTEKTFGVEAARRVYDFQMDRYLRQRAAQARDVPLLEVHDQPWIFYGKGAVVMYLLRGYIGADAVNSALRRYLEKHRAGEPPYPTSLDVYAELRAVTPDSLHYLLTDLFETVTLWDVETERAVVEPTGSGKYVVTLDIVAKKVRADSVGNETEIPMDDFVDIGVFSAGHGPGESDGPGEPLYLERHRINSGEQTIRITVPRAPGRAGIDPYGKLIDRDRRNNVVELEAAGADPAGGGS